MFHGTCGGTVSRVKNNTISMREYFFCNQILLGQCQCMRGSTCSTKLVDWLLQSVTIFNSWPEICYHLLPLVVTKPEICYIWPDICYRLLLLFMAKHDNFPDPQVLLLLLVTDFWTNSPTSIIYAIAQTTKKTLQWSLHPWIVIHSFSDPIWSCS